MSDKFVEALAVIVFVLVFEIVVFLEGKSKNEKPKRQPLALGDDGELSEDWELVINPVEGVKDE